MAAFFGANEIWNRHDDGNTEPVILAGVWETGGTDYSSEEEFMHSLDELGELARACMMEPVDTVTQQLPKVNAALYVGSGKAEEIGISAEYLGAKRVIFNDTLTPSQIRNLQKKLDIPVMDRTALILEIFERRARTREAKLQVELAKLRYLRPRLIGMWETQNRQGGASGSMSSKGEGETQLEIDRRTIGRRISELERELKKVVKERGIQKKKRKGSGLPLAALIGYTNAGKSTIMNAMLERYEGDTAKNGAKDSGRKVFEADMLFATLDTTVRHITVSKGREFLLSDTVGFIHKLPTSLIEAFRSTLEEVTEADILLQVVDGSDPNCREHIEVTKNTIMELGAGHIPMITVFNKADLLEAPGDYPRAGLKENGAGGFRNANIYISAKQEESVEFLADTIFEVLEGGRVIKEFTVPYEMGNVVSWLMENAVILETEYADSGTRLTVKCSEAAARYAEKLLS